MILFGLRTRQLKSNSYVVGNTFFLYFLVTKNILYEILLNFGIFVLRKEAEVISFH